MKLIQIVVLCLLPALCFGQATGNGNAYVPSAGGGATSVTGSNGVTASPTTGAVGVSLTPIAQGLLGCSSGCPAVPSVLSIGNGLALTSTTLSASYTLRSTGSTTDTILASDFANGIRYTSASAVAVTVPQATGSFATGSFDVDCSGAGTCTLTPTTSTINGVATLPLPGGTSVTVVATGGNYVAYGTGSSIPIGALAKIGANQLVGNCTSGSAVPTGTCQGALIFANSLYIPSGSQIALDGNLGVGTNGILMNSNPWISGVVPTTTGMTGFGTGPSVNGSSTGTFMVTEGATGSPSTTGVVLLHGTNNFYACQITDVDSSTITARQSGLSASQVTVTFSAAPANSARILFNCGSN